MNELTLSYVKPHVVYMLMFPAVHVEKEKVARFQIVEGDLFAFEGLIP